MTDMTPETLRDWLAEIDAAYAHPIAADNLLRTLAIEMSKRLTEAERRLAAIECAECGKNLMQCKCDYTEGQLGWEA